MKKIINLKSGNFWIFEISKDYEDDFFIFPGMTLVTPGMTFDEIGAKAWSIGIRFFWYDCYIAWCGKVKKETTFNAINKMTVKEFQEQGFLQEVNRQFFHPLGIALEVIIDRNGEMKFGKVWDYRVDEDGMRYDLKNSNLERIQRFQKNANHIESLRKEKAEKRMQILGYVIEPIPSEEENK